MHQNMHIYAQISKTCANTCENMDLLIKYMQIYIKICTQNMQLYIEMRNLYAFVCQNMQIKYANM